jgi:hypothetical protein
MDTDPLKRCSKQAQDYVNKQDPVNKLKIDNIKLKVVDKQDPVATK